MFTMENTEGFDQKTLDKMNSEVKKTMSKHDPKSKDYKKYSNKLKIRSSTNTVPRCSGPLSNFDNLSFCKHCAGKILFLFFT